MNSEIQDFVQFAARRIARGDVNESVEELVEQWRRDSEFADAVADVRQGLTDDAAGQAESVSEVFADVRRRLGTAA